MKGYMAGLVPLCPDRVMPGAEIVSNTRLVRIRKESDGNNPSGNLMQPSSRRDSPSTGLLWMP